MKNSKIVETISWILIVLGVILFICSFIFLKYPFVIGSLASIGDINSGLSGSIWSLGGVLLFYAALKSQQESLDIQRKEFELQREELKETRQVFEEQNKSLKLDRFESTFFLILKWHKDVLESLKLKPSNHEIVGRFTLEHLWKEFKNNLDVKNVDLNIKFITNKFTAFCNSYDHILNTYSSTVFNNLMLIDTMEIADKQKYVNLYRAQLSHIEKEILFYLGAHGENNLLKPLIEKYKLLFLLDTTQLLDPSQLTIYDLSAYEA